MHDATTRSAQWCGASQKAGGGAQLPAWSGACSAAAPCPAGHRHSPVAPLLLPAAQVKQVDVGAVCHAHHGLEGHVGVGSSCEFKPAASAHSTVGAYGCRAQLTAVLAGGHPPGRPVGGRPPPSPLPAPLQTPCTQGSPPGRPLGGRPPPSPLPGPLQTQAPQAAANLVGLWAGGLPHHRSQPPLKPRHPRQPPTW